MLTVSAYGYAAIIDISDLVAKSEVVVLAQVTGMRTDCGSGGEETIASAAVLETWKGTIDGGWVEYVASPGWYACDVSAAKVGETVVLFLERDPKDERLRIAHYGRGRMAVVGDPGHLRVRPYEVVFPVIGRPGRDGDRLQLDFEIDIAALAKLVRADPLIRKR